MSDDSTLLTLGDGAAAAGGLLPADHVVAGYRIEGRAGAGGMGVVYRAVDQELGRLVALKVIAPEYARDVRFRELFKDESRKAAALEHPNVIPIYRSGEEDGLLYIAMRFVDGPSLQELIDRRGRLPLGAAVRIVSQVADALDAAHAHGLVHRDVKPGNILVADAAGEERVSLTDFGLSVPIADAGHRAGRLEGTPGYLAPEQIRGDGAEPRSDVYALGCVLFHALTGRAPFAGRGLDATVIAHLTEAPPAVTAVVPTLPGKLDDVVRTAMAKRPEDRFASAGALAEAAKAARSDVVIYANAVDAQAAQSLATRLAGQGLEVRVAGDDAADDLWSAHACLLLVGRDDLASWARDLLASAGDLTALDPRFRLVSVLLPGAPEPFDGGLEFLAARPFVDLRDGVEAPHATGDLLRAVDASPRAAARAGVADVCPYPGLEAFQEADAELFFGRGRETALLESKLRSTRFVAVLGASGSGKSSLVRAGLLPALRAAGPIEVVLMTPGPSPTASLAAQLERALGAGAPDAGELSNDTRALDRAADRLAGEPGGRRLVVVVDQFEETFSLNPNPREQRAFIDNLVYAATIPGGSATVVLAMRSDFYHRAADHLALRSLVAERQFLVGPLDAESLRETIEEPARLAGLELEHGLVRRIISDVSDQPGALPLMEHLLAELWRRRRGRTLTLEAYSASGGVSGALAKRANETYGSMTPEQQAIARRVLLRLTQPGEGTEDTRRRALMAELTVREDEAREVEDVVARLGDARLVVLATDDATGEPAVEVTHEALIRGWPQLRAWIDADRESLRLHRRLTEAADEWHAAERDDGALYRGARLAAWQERPTDELNDRERAFLDASRARADVERAARRRRTRAVAAGSLVAAVAVAAGVGVAITKSRDAGAERASALSRQLARSSVVNAAPDPELAILLARAAEREDATPQAEEALRQAVHDSRVRGALRGTGTVLIAVSPVAGSSVSVAGEDGSLRIWDPAGDPRGASAAKVGTWPAGITKAVETPLGHVTGGPDGAVVLWPAGGPPRAVGSKTGAINDLNLTRNPAQVVVASASDVRTWDLRSGKSERIFARAANRGVALAASGAYAVVDEAYDLHILTPGRDRPIGVDGDVYSLAVSPDRRLLAVGTDARVQLWSVGAEPRRISSRSIDLGVSGMAFSPAGAYLAAGLNDASVRVFAVAGGPPLAVLRGHGGPVAAVTFQGDDRVVSVSTDGTARAWEWRHGIPTSVEVGTLPIRGGVRLDDRGGMTLVDASGRVATWSQRAGLTTVIPGGADSVAAAAVAPDRSLIVEAFPDGRTVALGRTGAVVGKASVAGFPVMLALRPDGARFAVAAITGNSEGEILELARDGRGKPRIAIMRSSPALAVAYAPTGDAIAGGFQNGEVMVARGGADAERLGAHDGGVYGIAFSPDGRWLATSSADRTLRVWDLSANRLAHTLRGHAREIEGLAFSADGRLLASASADGVRIWDWARELTVLHLPMDVPGALQVDTSGKAPRIAYYGPGTTVRVSDCDVCGSLQDVNTLVQARTTRDLSAAERSGYGISGSSSP